MSLRLRLGALALSLICATGSVAADELTLNLRDTNISNLIDLVSEETGTNFIVDPRVRGNITVVSSRPVPRDELMDLFHDILKIHGFAAIPGESSTRIVPDAQAKQDTPTILDIEAEPDADVRGGSIVTHVIALRHVAAAQLVPVLRPLIPQGGHLAAATEPNTLLISDTRSNVHRIRALVERMDLPFADDFEVIELRHARAGELAEQLQVLAREGTGELATPQVLADRRSNAIILSGREESRLRLRGLIAQLDREMEEGNARVHYLKYARAEEVAELLRNIAEKSPDIGPDEQGGNRIHIEAHESTNAVVTYGPSDFIRDFDIIVEQLDIRRAQVLVEAVIAEVSSDRVQDLGVQWGAIGNSGAGVLNFSGPGSRGILELAAGVEGFLDGSVSSPPDIGDGLTAGGVGSTGSTRIAALVNMLQRDTSSNILSTPSLLTLDNEEAEIVVGQNVPFIVGRSIEDSGQAFDTIRREDVGVKLRVRPQINQGNAVRLEIEQEVSQLAPGTSGAADLITNTRTLKTHVLIDDGDMLVLGGLIEEQQTDSEARVPGLGSIPGLGRLFRADRNQTEKRNLMVFLHPRIVRDSARGAELTSEKYSFIRGEQLREQARTQQRRSPVLPEWERLTQLPPSFEDVHGHRD
ncbi:MULTISPECIES: type II secretion system secretin GspD [Thioalkalivibrio]|uniref:type II secretion system secretin GspD n=1 Tax=Thioalkalivibrio TaxID=106633 RepID=UPI00036EE32C|nr:MULTISPECIES: type II secretion system secretin GspD [Thioalkalivibrio]OOC48660.1 type II secretion system protein GspD [Thioalkalivibrio versutus]